MLQRTGIFLFISLFCCLSAFPQQSAVYTSDYAQYQHGIKLYRQHQYAAAQRIFKQVHQHTHALNLKAETAYYSAISAVRLQQPDAEKQMRDFVEDYPESPRRNSAYTNVAQFYFKSGQYAEARKWYQKVNPYGLTASEKPEYNFNRGYTAFKTQHPKQAKHYFTQVKNDAKYGSQANYYLGFLAYKNNNYQEAKDLFADVDQKDQVNKKVSYFQSNISFKSGNFKKAIAEAQKQLPRSTRHEQSELHKIIGESYFNLKEYAKAIPHLEKYNGKRGRWSNTDYYQLGYAYYKTGNYTKAIAEFNKIINGQNAVAQNAYYHLAECYIKLQQKQPALNAFKKASEMNFDATIKEDAALNYAKLSYDIGNSYKSVPEVLTQFLKEYPNSPARSEIKSLLVNSYITSKNYKKAMTLLAHNPSFHNQTVLQKVAFLRGLELYRSGDYTQALALFKKSIAQHKAPVFTARATYWAAECSYNLGDFQKALIGYKQFKGMAAAQRTPEIEAINYNIGYAYFNQKKYREALQNFKAYTQQSGVSSTQKNDAYLRMGDSYFALSDYWHAMEEYNQAIAMKNVNSDYAYYQKAISYGFVNRNKRKIEDLNAFLKRFPNSIYKDDALYQLGNTYLAENQSQKALQTYTKIVNNMPNSNYVARAMMKQGLIYYNTNQNTQALAKFKAVAAKFPRSKEANQAVRSARNIYVDNGNIDAYAKWVKTLGYVNLADNDIDNATFESAANQLVDQNADRAIKGFEKYLSKFPDGAHALSAHFKLGQLFVEKNDLASAEAQFIYVTEQPRNQFTEKSLGQLARIYLQNKAYAKATPVLQRLEKEASLQKDITFAQSNLMKAYYKQQNYPQTVAYAEKVLANAKAGNQAKSDAHIFIARSAIKTGQEEKAKEAYAQVAKMAQGELAAEAHYYDAYFKRKAKDYKASNQAIQVLTENYSGYKEWGVKGLLLMAQNFYDLDQAFQATYILQNIIDNFKDYPTVVTQAKSELKRIKTAEAKTNSSIHIEKNSDTTSK